MKYGVFLPNFGAFGDARTIAELAQVAESAGWDGLFVWDHLARRFDTPVVDPWIALSAAAMVTQQIKLGAMVTPLARRRPWKFARETASLDHLSKGRLIVGVGLGSTGGAEVEWANFGEEMDLRKRGQMLDEALTIIDGLWRGDPFAFEGQHYQVQESRFLPPSYQRPRIPVWVAGYWDNKKPFRRAAQWDGVFPNNVFSGDDLSALEEAIAYTRHHRESDAPFDVVVTAPPTAKPERASMVEPFARVGVTWWLENIKPEHFGMAWDAAWDVDAMRAHIEAGV